MKKLLPFLLGLFLMVSGCAAFKAAVPLFESDAEQLAEQATVCVLGQVAMGNTTASSIGIACGIPLATTVISMATKAAAQIEAATLPKSDAGLVGVPQVAGVDTKTLAARLRTVH